MKRFVKILVCIGLMFGISSCNSCKGKVKQESMKNASQVGIKRPSDASVKGPSDLAHKILPKRIPSDLAVAVPLPDTQRPVDVSRPKDLQKPDIKVAVVPDATKPQQVKIVEYWIVRRPSGSSPDIFALTFVVKNLTSSRLNVRVSCFNEGRIYGQSNVKTISANDTSKLMVRMFRTYDMTVNCSAEVVGQ